MPEMLAEMRRCFERVANPVAYRGLKPSDCLMSGLAVFAHRKPPEGGVRPPFPAPPSPTNSTNLRP